jgi:putative PIN family toxin of toxin-antitoxin system
MTRVVADTNILISAFLYGGLPRRFLDAAEAGKFVLLTSLDLLEELEKTLGNRKFNLPQSEISGMRFDFEGIVEMISPHISVQAVDADPDDDCVLECALAGRADFVVRGDRHLLDLKIFREIPILTARQFMDRLLTT